MTEATETFSDREFEVVQVQSIDDDGTAVTWTNGWSMALPEEARGKLEMGGHYVMEKKGFNTITGLGTLDNWLYHHSDEHLEEERRQWEERINQRDRERLEQHREEFEFEEAALPDYLRKRIERFRANGGELFDLRYWPYELMTSRLMALYIASGGEETEEIGQIAQKYATSGNQHDFARWAAEILHSEGEDAVIALPAAMTPITGDPDYSNLS